MTMTLLYATILTELTSASMPSPKLKGLTMHDETKQFATQYSGTILQRMEKLRFQYF